MQNPEWQGMLCMYVCVYVLVCAGKWLRTKNCSRVWVNFTFFCVGMKKINNKIVRMSFEHLRRVL